MPGGRDIRAGRSFIELYLKNQLGKGLKNAGRMMKNWSANIGAIGARIAALGGAITGPLSAAALKFAATGDDLHKLSARSGVGVQALSELGHAAELSGTNIKQLGDALIRSRRRIANAAEGTGPAVRAMKELGLAANEITKLPVDQQFDAIVAAMGKMENQSLANQMAFEIFGDSSKALLPLLHSGTAGIEAMRQEARELGITMSQDDANAAAALTDAMARLKSSLTGIIYRVGGAIAPMLTDLAGKLTSVIGPIIQWVRGNQALIVTAAKIGAVISAAGAALLGMAGVVAVIGAGLSGLGTIVAAAGTAISAIVSPITVAIAAIAALGYYLLFHTEQGANALSWLGEQFHNLLTFIKPIIQGIKNALAAGDLKLAAKIAWLGLKLAFAKGASAVKSVWRDFTTGLVQLFDDAFMAIQRKWRSLNTSVAELLITIGDKLGLLGNVSAAQVVQTLREDAVRMQRLSEGRYERRTAGRGAALDEAAEADRKELERLQRELSKSTEEARVAAKDAKMRRAKMREAEDPKLPNFGQAVSQAQTRAVGTFSAAAAAMAGRAGNKQVQLLTDIRGELVSIRRNTENGDELEFQP